MDRSCPTRGHGKLLLLLTLGFLAAGGPTAAAEEAASAAPARFKLTTRRAKEVSPGSGRFETVEAVVEWAPAATAIIVCDMWDQHWCRSATRRVGEMAPRMNATLAAARRAGALIIHAPSDTMKTYEETPQRRRAREAPVAEPPVPITGGCPLEKSREGTLPIDDGDGGCDCEPQCKNFKAWNGQHPGLEIAPEDAVSDSGREIYNLMAARGIQNVVLLGVHTNMCVLGRSFGIRQMVRLGKNVVLCRDLTDTMYNPRRAPFVPHARGTELVVEHIERYWCPSIVSADLLGAGAPRAGAAAKARIVLVIAEDEYRARDTLPVFAKELEARLGAECAVLHGKSKTDLPGLEALAGADLLFLYARRTTLPAEQLEAIQKYVRAGKPLVALRTASHAFENWKEFDRDVLGGNYHGHHGAKSVTEVAVAPGTAAGEPLLAGVETPFRSPSWLYKVSPLAAAAKPLLVGTCAGQPSEPVAWTNPGAPGRVFYTSLGHPGDFELAPFRRLLLNAAAWALGKSP